MAGLSADDWTRFTSRVVKSRSIESFLFFDTPEGFSLSMTAVVERFAGAKVVKGFTVNWMWCPGGGKV